MFDIFLIVALNIDLGCSLESLEADQEAVLRSTHNLCLQAKMRKN